VWGKMDEVFDKPILPAFGVCLHFRFALSFFRCSFALFSLAIFVIELDVRVLCLPTDKFSSN
jgi:hypothetical protein